MILISLIEQSMRVLVVKDGARKNVKGLLKTRNTNKLRQSGLFYRRHDMHCS